MWRRARTGVLVVLVSVMPACGVVEDLRTSDFAKQDVGAIVEAAVDATQEVESVRITGPFWQDGADYFIDLWVNRAGECKGTIRRGGTHMDLRRVDGKTWFKGDEGFFNTASQGRFLPQALLDKVSTRWVLLEKADPKSPFQELCDLDDLFKDVKVSTGKEAKELGEAKRGDETDLDGTRAVQVKYSPGGAYTTRVWVASEAPHYVVKSQSDEPREQHTLVFSAFNEEFTVTRPRPKETFTP